MSALDLEVSIDAVSVLSLRPGDTLVVKTACASEAQAAQIKAVIKSQLTVDAPVIIVPPGTELVVVRPAE